MANPRIRESLDGSESNFSLIDHAFADESTMSDGGLGGNVEDAFTPQSSAAAVRAYYPISTIMSNPRAASAAQTISTNLSNLNPLRATTGPKTGATRGKAATPITLSELPKVSSKDFDTYIVSIKDDFTAWSKIQSAIADAPVLDELDDDDTLLDEETSKRRKAIRRALETSNISNKSNRKLELPSLETIPPIFFEENFNLANPRTFDVVTGGHAAAANASSNSVSAEANTDFATDQIFQEKLSHWLDIVELHLNVEISLRSASFFSALSNLKELDSQSAEAVKQIAELKSMLDSVDAKVAREGLAGVRQGVRRRRLNDLDVALDRIKEILRAVEQAEDLGEAGETEGALDLADEIEREWETSLYAATLQIPPTPAVERTPPEVMTIISEEDEEVSSSNLAQTAKPPATPLTALRPREDHHAPVRIAQIKCLADIPTRLKTLRGGIAQALEQELVAVLLHAVREGRDTLLASTAQWRESPGTQASIYDTIRDNTSSRIRTCLYGLIRCGKQALDDAIGAWRQALLREVRKTVREVLPAASAQDEDDMPADNTPSSRSSFEGGRSPADGSSQPHSMQSLEQEEYLRLMRELHTSMLALLVLADLQSRAIASTVKSLLEAQHAPRQGGASSTTISTEQALNQAWTEALQSELTDGVQAVAELVNVRLARIVASRGEVHSHLPLLEFWTAFSESWQFVLDCETICRKMIVGLRGVIVGQAKAFLQEFHQRTFLEVAQAVEQEQWSPADVPVSVQKSVDAILQSAVETPSGWDFKREQVTNNMDGKAAAKQLAIEDKSYFAVTATLLCLTGLESYLKVVINLPLLSTDVMSRIIEFLKQYNSRVCQMVLGAGAMRSAGLKNITAKHLAMASQSISILISIIPYTRECLRRHLRAKQAVILVDFDKLKRDCQEHQNEIHAKLVAIMGDRLAVHCKTLQEIDWEAGVAASGKPNAYMETLVKETGTLHKVLLKYLAGSALEVVMMQVLSAINSRLAEEYSKIPLKSQAAKDRMLADATFLKEKFADLRGLERAPPGAELVHLVQDKMVEQPPAIPPTQIKGRQFSTPSLTRPHKNIRSHSRTASAVSLTETDDQATPASEASRPVQENTEIKAPSLATDSEAQTIVIPGREIHDTGSDANTQSDPPAEAIPLPKSPETEVPPTIAEILNDDAQPKLTHDEEGAPTTPSKDHRSFTPPVPEKSHDNHGTPTVNVKNRLAGLFSKRPTLPNIPVPAVPNLLPKNVLNKGKPAPTVVKNQQTSSIEPQQKEETFSTSNATQESESIPPESLDLHNTSTSSPEKPVPVLLVDQGSHKDSDAHSEAAGDPESSASSTDETLAAAGTVQSPSQPTETTEATSTASQEEQAPIEPDLSLASEEILSPPTEESAEDLADTLDNASLADRATEDAESAPNALQSPASIEGTTTTSTEEQSPLETALSAASEQLQSSTIQESTEDLADTSGSTGSTVESESEQQSVETLPKDTTRDVLDEID